MTVRGLAATIAATMLVADAGAGVAASRHHHGHTAHHANHATTRSHRDTHEHGSERADRHAASGAPGTTTIPAGGLKLYCAARNPLLIRKSTQGRGTTVTVICR